MTAEKIVLEQIQEFVARNHQILFQKFYDEHLEVYQSSPNDLSNLLLQMRNPDVATKSLEQFASISRDLAFPSMPVLKAHVTRQFESTDELIIEVIEQAAYGNYVLLRERKTRYGETIEALCLYFVQDEKILKMWIARTK